MEEKLTEEEKEELKRKNFGLDEAAYQDLIRAVKAGDTTRFDQIYDDYRRRVRSAAAKEAKAFFVYALTSATNYAFAQFYVRLGSDEPPEYINLMAYVTRSVLNEYRREASRLPTTELIDGAAPMAPNGAPMLAVMDEKQETEDKDSFLYMYKIVFIKDLCSFCKKIIHLRHGLNWAWEDIAEELNFPNADTAKHKGHTIKVRLERMLKNKQSDPCRRMCKTNGNRRDE